MPAPPETVKVEDGKGSFYFMNKSDFDSSKHKLYEDPKEAAANRAAEKAEADAEAKAAAEAKAKAEAEAKAKAAADAKK